MAKLNDDELANVVGGIKEQADIPTKGMDITCPVCETGNNIKRGTLWDPKTGSVEYACNCGARFVYYGKNVIMRDEWIEMCKSEGYIYPFE